MTITLILLTKKETSTHIKFVTVSNYFTQIKESKSSRDLFQVIKEKNKKKRKC